MKRTRTVGVVLSILILAGCGTQPASNSGDAAPSSAEGASTTGSPVAKLSFQPGRWSVKTDITQLDMPGAGDERVTGAIGAMIKKRQSVAVTHCMTAAEAESPSTKMFGGREGAQCRRDTLVMDNGRLQSAITCTRGSEGTMTVAATGTYSATAYDLVSDMKMTNPQMPGGAMTMKARVTGQRIGECTSGEKKS